MNHCFLLLTHFSAEETYEQVLDLMDEKHFFVIHFDRKTVLHADDPYVKKLRALSKVRLVEDRLNVQWGSYATVEATFRLIREALHFGDTGYMHLISGQCRHVKPIAYIHDHFRYSSAEYLHCADLAEWPAFFSRLTRYHLHDYYNVRSKNWKDVMIRRLNKVSLALQNLLAFGGIYRHHPVDFPKIYIGSAWWSLTSECCRYMLEYTKTNPSFQKRFRYTQLPDEMFFQTLIMQSRFGRNVVNNNLRFIAFKTRHAEELTLEYKAEVSGPDVLFARKITAKSAALMDFIRTNMLVEQEA